MLTRGIFLILTSIFLLFETGKAGQDDITVTASVNNNSLFSGERFVYTIEISGANLQDISRPRLPEIHNARNFSQIPSTSSSISIINGVYSARYSYSFTLEALNEGAIEIPAIEIEVAGNMYRTNPISLWFTTVPNPGNGWMISPKYFFVLNYQNGVPTAGNKSPQIL